MFIKTFKIDEQKEKMTMTIITKKRCRKRRWDILPCVGGEEC